MHKTLLTLAALTLAFGLSACDSDDLFEDDTVVYQAVLTELNDSGVEGTATFTISDEGDLEITDDDTFIAEILAEDLDDVLHPQHIHADAECPTEAADVNDDGFVSVAEGVPAYGPILIPLDGQLLDMGTQAGTFPEGEIIDYDEAVDFDDFLDTYQVADPNPDDNVVTLGVNGPLNLDRRTVVLHGTARDLPDSVESLPGLDNTTTLPVACGELVLVAVSD